MRRRCGDRRARGWMRGGAKDGMAARGVTGAALFMMHSSFSTAGSSWVTTPTPLDAQAAVGKSAAVAKVDVHLDGAKRTTIRVTWDDVLAGRNRVVISGKDLKPGEHTITLAGDSRTPIYYAVTADSFRKPKQIHPESRGLAVERRYFRVPAETGKPVTLKTGEPLKVGDVIEVELKITAAADYEFLAFEDPKPAGCEPVQVRSGSVWGDGFWGNVELRHRKVVFFAAWLPRGTQTVRYRLGAETSGEFTVLPPTAFAMYNPDVHARGSGERLRIAD